MKLMTILRLRDLKGIFLGKCPEFFHISFEILLVHISDKGARRALIIPGHLPLFRLYRPEGTGGSEHCRSLRAYLRNKLYKQRCHAPEVSEHHTQGKTHIRCQRLKHRANLSGHFAGKLHAADFGDKL